ncbi:MAG: class Ib ribonucleoside-diphosphate reductase assembly flavoprotein NrdI [Streptococcaceae bacterium]|jgi:protein involved in ribonucleotide reduction|nr:class Ib ribonucleoside-diphosphate reductase assembly flavoprotein NrdI [Streptococcaceae bacterium]
MKLVFFSVTGNTRRFVEKVGLSADKVVEITADNPEIELTEPFVLIVPCYERATTNPVWEFMNWAGNSQACRGLIGGGNRNFAGLFIYTAKDLAADFMVPLLYGFEFSGMPNDHAWVRNWIETHEK